MFGRHVDAQLQRLQHAEQRPALDRQFVRAIRDIRQLERKFLGSRAQAKRLAQLLQAGDRFRLCSPVANGYGVYQIGEVQARSWIVAGTSGSSGSLFLTAS